MSIELFQHRFNEPNLFYIILNVVFHHVRKQAKEMGRKTKLHDWKEIISTQEKDIMKILEACGPYKADSLYSLELESANQKLQDVKEQLEIVVKKLSS